MPDALSMKRCFREPIPEIFDVARYLDAAASAHLAGNADLAVQLLEIADDARVREWLESIWGKNSSYVKVTKLPKPVVVSTIVARMPGKQEKAQLLRRDGFHCRYCRLPVIRPEIRQFFKALYPNVVSWGRSNNTQHAAFQVLWAQYDHVLPHSHGGTNHMDNLVVSCAACNFGKMSYTVEELGLADPRQFEPVTSIWDGLERVLQSGTTRSGG